MATKQLSADKAFVVHLRSYGFFHSGRERLLVQVLKRTWEHIPGSTLYGAVAAALIRLDGLDEETDCFEDREGGYYDLLRAVKAHQIRFTPLLPVAERIEKVEDWTGAHYCKQAMRLHAAVYADAKAQPERADRQLFHTTPHAPLSRPTEQIHEDQLFAVRTHRPLLDYYGFIFADAGLKLLLQRAFRLFPLMPVGGRGKFSLVEAALLGDHPLDRFEKELRKWGRGRTGWVRLLTPMVLGDGQANELLAGNGREMVVTGLRRYRVWRTGRYYDAVHKTFGQPMGTQPGIGVNPKVPFRPGGLESDAVRAVPERSRFRLVDGDDEARWFIEGVGHPSWTYLGWGQVVIE